jgi:PmbA protein
MNQTIDMNLYWKDNTRSTHTFSGKFKEFNKETISELKKQAFYDEIIPDLPNPKQIKDVKVYDDNVKHIFDDASYLFKSISFGRDNLLSVAKNLGGDTGVSILEKFVRNSEGFSDSEISTSSYIDIYADSVYSQAKSSRKLFTEKDLNFIVDDIKEYLPYFNKTVGKNVFNNGNLEIILPNSELTKLINFFIIKNLNSESIDTKQSAFTIDDIKNEKQIMRSDINLVINNTKDFSIGSHKFSSVGNPSGIKELIANGNVKTPIVGLKYSKKFGLGLTPEILSYESLEFGNGKTTPIKDAYRSIKEGVIITGFLGLHTQDPTSGSYSLNCNNCLYVKDGEIIGKGNVLINGNFFNDLLKDDFTFVKYPEDDFPGAKLRTNVTIID